MRERKINDEELLGGSTATKWWNVSDDFVVGLYC